MFQKDSALAQWFRARTENARGSRKTMIVALARKLLICGGSCGRAWCRAASFCALRHDREDAEGSRQFWPSPSACDGLPMTVRGGGDPMDSMAYQAATENGSAASELRNRCVLLHHGSGP